MEPEHKMSSNKLDNLRKWTEQWIGTRSLEPAEARHERLVNLITLAIAAAGALAGFWIFALWLRRPEAVNPPVVRVIVAVLLMGVTAYAFARAGRVKTAAWMTTLSALAIAAYVVIGQGIASTSVIVLAPMVMLAGLLVGSRAASIVVGIETLIVVALGLAQDAGWQPAHGPPSLWIGVIIIIGSLTFLLFTNRLSWRLMKQSLDLAETRAERLRAAHQEQQRLVADLKNRDERQAQLLTTLQELSTPVIPVTQGIIILPLIGRVDVERLAHLRSTLLTGIAQHRAKTVILEMTGVPELDGDVARGLLGLADAARLLGAEAIIVGVQARVARVMVRVAIDTSGLMARPDLESALAYALARQRAGRPGASSGVMAAPAKEV